MGGFLRMILEKGQEFRAIAAAVELVYDGPTGSTDQLRSFALVRGQVDLDGVEIPDGFRQVDFAGLEEVDHLEMMSGLQEVDGHLVGADEVSVRELDDRLQDGTRTVRDGDYRNLVSGRRSLPEHHLERWGARSQKGLDHVELATLANLIKKRNKFDSRKPLKNVKLSTGILL